MYRAFTYRLEPTVKQAQALRRSMLLQCELYNAALEERRMSYEWLGRGISTKRSLPSTTSSRHSRAFASCGPSSGPSFQGFFRRLKAGQAPGYPRFRSASRWDSLSWCDLSGWKFEEGSRRLYRLFSMNWGA
ncbi:MAG: helix-turn-helix domain-containing protein [Acidimicrobiales bacterium]